MRGLWKTAVVLWALAAPAGLAQAPGQQLYDDNCSACHQKTGLGVPQAFPALKDDQLVLGPPGPAAAVVLNGRGGMPAFRDSLTDADLAQILTYVRGAWGNQAGPLTPEDFTALRNGPPPPDRLQAH